MSIPVIRREGQKRLRLKIAADVATWTWRPWWPFRCVSPTGGWISHP